VQQRCHERHGLHIGSYHQLITSTYMLNNLTQTGGLLTYSGSTSFTGDSVPSGTTQVTVYSGTSHAQDITLSIVSS
jgi:hypothetical protein